MKILNENLQTADDAVPQNTTSDIAVGSSTARSAGFFQRIWLLLLVAFVAVIVDQITKRLVETRIALGQSVDIAAALSPYLSFTHTKNPGAAFSMLQEGGAIFFVVGAIVTLLILYYAPRLPLSDWLSRLALGLQLGGAIGNLVDRTRIGVVTDFIHFQIPQWNFDWPVFNVADSCIVMGVIILIVSSLLRGEGKAD